jgi:heptaprenyl diphosphate synthase
VSRTIRIHMKSKSKQNQGGFSTPDFLRSDLETVRRLIAETLTTGHPFLDAGLKRFIDYPGKMLRPTLLLLSAHMGEFDSTAAHRLAAAVEILHIATLIHDDIIDNSPLRRGTTSIHVTEGLRQAVLTGDFLFTRCFRLTADQASPEVAKTLATVVGRICESEIDHPLSSDISLRAYLRRTAGKTALLFLMSMYMGAKESGCDEGTCSTMRKIGYGIGMGFQIIDDILDFTGSEENLGKPTGNDIAKGVMTLPMILASRTTGEIILPYRRRWMRNRNAEKIRQKVTESGGLDMARDVARRYTEKALADISTLPDGQAKTAMVDLTNDLLGRKY